MFECVDEWSRLLGASLDRESGLDDTGRIDAIRALEALACVTTAAQAALAAELDASQRAAQAAAGVPAARAGQGVAAQVALARRESHRRGQRHLGLAKAVTAELPHTWAAWRQGLITEWRATLIARETACLSVEDRAHVDEVVAGDSERLAAMGDRELVAACQREAYQVDAASFVSRRRRAEADRHVSLRPAPDCMTWLTALLPVKEGVMAYAALSRRADAARAHGDARSRGQVMADALAHALVQDSRTPARRTDASVALGLVMTDESLLGHSDEPAHLDGYGPIPAELAREIVAGACSSRERVWIRRLYTSPETGELVAMDSRARFFPAGMARFVRLRDRVCRTPWCDAPIRHTDHADAYASGGGTDTRNGQGLCEACNHAKEAIGWWARPGPHHTAEVETTTPTGHRYRSVPPSIRATVRLSSIRLDYVLAG